MHCCRLNYQEVHKNKSETIRQLTICTSKYSERGASHLTYFSFMQKFCMVRAFLR